MKVLHKDCKRMLRTRFVLLVENSMTRRHSITKHSRDDEYVASFRAALASLQTSQFGCNRKSVKTLWLLIGLHVLGLLDLSRNKEDRLILPQRSPSYQVFCSVFGRIVHMPWHKFFWLCTCFYASAKLSCEQIPCSLQWNLHNIRVAHSTRHSDFDQFSPHCCMIPNVWFLLALLNR